MPVVRLFLALLAAAFLVACVTQSARDGAPRPPARGLAATDLRCEYLTNPMGVDVEKPRLSWVLQAAPNARDKRQTAYQVLVASSPDAAARGQGDLWDSGRVQSADTISIEYAGRPMATHQRCWWRVRVWDERGEEGPWSATASWSTGFANGDTWKAQWIGYDALRAPVRPDAALDGAKWIWLQGDDARNAPVASRGFFRELDLPGSRIQEASITITGDDKFFLFVNGNHVGMTSGAGDAWRFVRKIDLRPYLKPGRNLLAVRVENTTAGASGLIARLEAATDATRVTLVTDETWRATAATIENWNKATLANDMAPAAVAGAYGDQPWGRLKEALGALPPAAYLRGRFAVTKPVKSATLYATALGSFEARLNGRRAHTDYFPSGWTDYNKRVYYRAYDVTPLLRQGDNVLAAALSDGWYSSYIGWHWGRDHYGKNPRFAAQLHLEYADGTRQDILTDNSWKAAPAGGPVREADLLMGETYDARKELAQWDAPSFQDAEWAPVATGAELQPRVQWHMGPPVLAFKDFPAKEVAEPRPGVYVFNLGQNIAGVPRLKIRGAAPGQTVSLRFAERLNDDGTLYTVNLRTARVTDSYVCRGGGEEIWTPQFTFHGFQYVEVTGLPTRSGRPPLDTVTGVFLGSDTPDAGRFASSAPMLNQLHSNTYWTQRANFLDIPTDCPQRDERLGWTGDAQIYVRTATLNSDVHAFFNKWLIDLEDSQRPDGQFPQIAPLKVAGSDGGPAWSDAGTIVPWTLYEVYGDKRILARQYESMKRFIEFTRKRSSAQFLPPGAPSTRAGRGGGNPYHAFGDWLSIEAPTPNDIIYMAYWYHSTVLTGKTADVLGKSDEAASYRTLAQNIKDAFNRTYVSEDGRITGNTQACYVLAIAYGLVDGPRRDAAARYLVEDIEKRGNHLSTGFIGTKDLMLALSKIGREDVAYRLLHQDSFPSWGFSIKHGATSIWERWDGWTPEKGFQDPGMNSFAHYSFGAVYQWMVENIGGIRGEGIAYERVRVEPLFFTSDLTHADVSYHSVRGEIRSRWAKKGDTWTLDVTIPPNVTAVVCLPARSEPAVREGGLALRDRPGVHRVLPRNNQLEVEVGSGRYVFELPLNTFMPARQVSQER